ncbi:protein kinase domain-containing protein [Klenkia brasiliensis]|uniref:protein kinase domain-containing protein n=1 Tax=Klenkia brasiliensis TaxID=333142 RepID=UPI001F60342D|nr:protein kinase [Klenkia brasiliensis]
MPELPVLADRYELRSLIATGGMGQVWRAHDRRLSRPVAVKVLRDEYAGDPEFLARFRAEARHAALLGHRNVTAVYDYGETGVDGGEHLAWLVMELVPGESLAAVRRRVGALPAEQVLDVVAQAGAGLAAAHEAGIVHRDVKPGNLLLRPDGSVAVTDFGIAWSAGSTALTSAGQVVGTAHYLSPEQARGQVATPAGDVYALGMVAYELLAGRRAFDGDNSVAVAMRQLHDEPDPLPDTVPAPVRELVAAMLVKDAAGRLADGDAVVAAAEGARRRLGATDEPTRPLAVVPPTARALLRTPGPDRGPARPRWTRRRVLASAALTGFLVVGGGAVAVVGLGGTTAPAVAEPATTSSTPAAVTLDAADWTGRPVQEVVAALTALGLSVTSTEVAGDGSTAGLVTGVDPTGTPLPPGAAVTVSYGSAAPAADPTTDPSPATVDVPAAPTLTVVSDTGAADTGAAPAAEQVPATQAAATRAAAEEPAGTAPGAGSTPGPDRAPGNGPGTGTGSGAGNGPGNAAQPGNGNGNGNGRGNGNGPGGGHRDDDQGPGRGHGAP